MIKFTVPDERRIRVIVDTDAACEADDPFAIVHALLSPKAIVKGIVAEHFNEAGSMEKSYNEILTILDAMDMKVPAYKGQLAQIDKDLKISEGAEFIANEAALNDSHPLFVLCQGAITNVAVALKNHPEINDKMTIIWIGTHGEAPYEAPFREFNAGNDITAANFVLKNAKNLWLVPSRVYTTIHIGIAEIERRIAPLGKIGEHLYKNLVDYNNSEFASWTKGESWSLGDSPAIAIALNPDCGHYKITKAPLVADDTSSAYDDSMPEVRIYTDVDSRYILEDMIAKIELLTN